MLDEVTTHLDSLTIRALASALKSWHGSIVLITHDRWFHKVVIEGMTMDDEDDEEEQDGVAAAGKTLLVDKGRVRVMEHGMEGYERLVKARMKKAAAKAAA